jgi:hypothetical protein
MPKMSPVTMPSNVGRCAKAIIAALVAGLTVLGKALNDNGGHLTAPDYIAAGVAFLLALGAVYTVPNLQPAPVAPQEPVTYDPAPNVTRDFVAAHFGKPGLGAGPHRDPLTGRYSKEP